MALSQEAGDTGCCPPWGPPHFPPFLALVSCVWGSSCLPEDLISPVWLPVSLLSFNFSPRPRKMLLLGLRCSGLWAELKALHAQSQELGDAVGHRQLMLRELLAKQQRILQWRQLVVRCWACRRVRVEV